MAEFEVDYLINHLVDRWQWEGSVVQMAVEFTKIEHESNSSILLWDSHRWETPVSLFRLLGGELSQRPYVALPINLLLHDFSIFER